MKLTELWAKAKVLKSTKTVDSTLNQTESEQTQIILKENKGNALIKCWNCGKETWVKKGSLSFREGLCSKCVDTHGRI